MNDFAKNVRELRLASGMTQKEFAQKCGVIERTVSYWETGKRECDLNTLIKISKTLDVSVDYLLGISDN